MSEEKIDVKKLTVSKALSLFMEGKIPKKDLKDAIDKDDIFKKLSYSELEDLLYRQRRRASDFPKELRIKSDDILYQYGRNISAGILMNLASKGYVSEKDVLKALNKTPVLLALAVVSEKENDKDKSAEKEEKLKDDVKEEPKETATPKLKKIDIKESEEQDVEENITTEPVEQTFTGADVLDKDTVKLFFSADRLIKMFFARKMTREFTEAYEDAFKDDIAYREKSSKDIIKELQEIFKDNLQALFIIVMRLHFRGMVLSQDVQDAIKAEFFTEKTFELCDEYDVLDKEGNVIYSYKRDDKKKKIESITSEVLYIEGVVEDESSIAESEQSIVENEGSIDESEQAILEDGETSLDDEAVVNYPILEPITREELSDAYKDDNVNGNVFGLIFSDEELLEMYKSGKVSIKIFTLINKDKRKEELLKGYSGGYVHLEDIMELYFEYDGISVEVLEDIIKELPQKVSIIRFISFDTDLKKIYELYKNRLIDFNILYLLRCQEFITESEYTEIRTLVNKDEFYASIESRVFYTRKPEEENQLSDKCKVEISDTERVLLSKVMGISEEEIDNISIIYSKFEDGTGSMLDGYHVISDKRDGLVIFGKFDYVSPIYVMRYEEAAYYLRSRDGIDRSYIYDDLLFAERLENNEQVRIVAHDENMAKTIVEAMCELSEEARERYIDDVQYMQEVLEYIKTIDENYVEKIKEIYNM